jgi:hypothetical protein
MALYLVSGIQYTTLNMELQDFLCLIFAKFLAEEAVDDFWFGLFFGEADGH